MDNEYTVVNFIGSSWKIQGIKMNRIRLNSLSVLVLIAPIPILRSSYLTNEKSNLISFCLFFSLASIISIPSFFSQRKQLRNKQEGKTTLTYLLTHSLTC